MSNHKVDEVKLYPLKFEPILKPIIWGGDDICKFKGISPAQKGIGESWEISNVKGSVSVVANGELAGKNLQEIIAEYKERLVGKKAYEKFKTSFPLLIKFIDAKDDLSIQVHPDDELGEKRHGSFGKTEMWYVVDAKPKAVLYSGFKKELKPEGYANAVKDGSFMEYLDRHEVKADDVFFLPAGRVHAIGAGAFVAEIQQTSDITYRIYDYDRRDKDGNPRELHTELAKDAIDFGIYDDHKTDYKSVDNELVKLEECEYFTTNLLELTKLKERELADIDSFVAYICMGGSAEIKDDNNNVISIKQGETILIPAETKAITIEPKDSVKLLETYV